MTDLPTREQFAELIVNICAGLTDDVMISGNPDSLLDPLSAAYAAALTRIEELEGKLAIAVNAAGVQEARATAAERRIEELERPPEDETCALCAQGEGVLYGHD